MSAVEGRARYINPLSIVGTLLTTFSAVFFLTFFFLDLFGFHSNPYLGIVTFLILPGAFVLGLLLIPLGLWRERHRAAHGQGRPELVWPTFDLRRPMVRRVALIVGILTVVNFAIVAIASVKAIEYADSRTFCTGTCHEPMEPQTVANLESVHAAVSCARCHIGPGAPGFIRAKWGGVRQLGGVVRDTFPRPIPAPVHDLPAATGTCVNCHTPDAYIGDVVRLIKTYADDEASTESVTTLTMRVGGGAATPSPQIHWHAVPGRRVEYIALDEKRESIPWVRVTEPNGQVREYVIDGVTPDKLAGHEPRLMDCTDCHNRLGHPIAPSPEAAIDSAIAKGQIPQTLPFVRREAIAAVKDATRGITRAERDIAEQLGGFYRTKYPQIAADPRVNQAIGVVQRVYRTNVFPAMNVQWGTYPNQLGHTEVQGCFRCHDDQHKASGGLVISQDCERCHRM